MKRRHPQSNEALASSALGRRALLIGGAAALFASHAHASAEITADDMVLGAASAPVTLIEYASTTCPHCAAFHANVWEHLNERYIASGRVRFVFRELPTPPAPVAVAGFQIARCGNATPEQYMARVGELFRQQQAIFSETTMGGIRNRLVAIGEGFGLTAAEVNAAITDRAGAERAHRFVASATAFNITGTPAFVINGALYQGALSGHDLFAALDAAAGR